LEGTEEQKEKLKILEELELKKKINEKSAKIKEK